MGVVQTQNTASGMNNAWVESPKKPCWPSKLPKG